MARASPLKTVVIPALYNGVSRQAVVARSRDQAEEQVNAWSTIARGLEKRAPTEHIATLTGITAPVGGAHIHNINRDSTNRYEVIVLDGDIKVYDTMTGTSRTVNYPGRVTWAASTSYPVGSVVQPTTPNGFLYFITTAGESGATEPTWPTTDKATVNDNGAVWEAIPDYLSSSDPENDFALVSVADYTFIVNKTVAVRMAPQGVDVHAEPTWYRWLNKFPIDNTLGSVNVYTGQPYQYSANPSLNSVSGTVQTFADLPDTASNGALYKVNGTDANTFEPFYVRRNGGVWEETIKPGLVNRVNALSMPHALVREANGVFTFAPFSWAPRRVGDENTNPPASFVGRKIRDVFFYQNRLGLLADENVLFSTVGDFGNFWRNTVTQELDSDLIDVATTETDVNILNYAVPFATGVLLFSDQTQFALRHGQQGLTKSSVSIKPTTHYQVNPNVDPKPLGAEAYFASQGTSSSIVWEYFTQQGVDSFEAADITAHVSGYVPKNLKKLVASTNHNAIFAISGDKPNRVYVYQFFWVGNKKVQSAWHYWEFPNGTTVLAMNAFGEDVYVLIERGSSVFLEKIDLTADAVAPGCSYQVFLDRRTELLTGVYDGGSDTTSFVLPYDADQSTFQLILTADFAGSELALLDPSSYNWTASAVLTVPGDYSGGQVLGGEVYTMTYQFSEQFLKDHNRNAKTNGRLQLRTWSVDYTKTAYFKTKVLPYGSLTNGSTESVAPAKIAEFTGKTIGSSYLTVGQPVFEHGTYRFGVKGNSKQAEVSIINDTHVASIFESAAWEAIWFQREG